MGGWGWGEEKRGVGREEGTGDNRNNAKMTENDNSADNDEDTDNKAVMQQQSADPETRLGRQEKKTSEGTGVRVKTGEKHLGSGMMEPKSKPGRMREAHKDSLITN